MPLEREETLLYRLVADALKVKQTKYEVKDTPTVIFELIKEFFNPTKKEEQVTMEIEEEVRNYFSVSNNPDRQFYSSTVDPNVSPRFDEASNKVSVDFLAKYYNAEKGYNNETWIKNANNRLAPKNKIQKQNLEELYENFNTYAPYVFSAELDTLEDQRGLTFSDIRNTLSPIHAAESNFGVNIIGSKTDGSMQVIYKTFKDNLDQGYLGPKFIESINEPTIKSKADLEKLSEKKFKKLMRDNRKFDHLLGTSVILQKLKANYFLPETTSSTRRTGS